MLILLSLLTCVSLKAGAATPTRMERAIVGRVVRVFAPRTPSGDVTRIIEELSRLDASPVVGSLDAAMHRRIERAAASIRLMMAERRAGRTPDASRLRAILIDLLAAYRMAARGRWTQKDLVEVTEKVTDASFLASAIGLLLTFKSGGTLSPIVLETTMGLSLVYLGMGLAERFDWMVTLPGAALYLNLRRARRVLPELDRKLAQLTRDHVGANKLSRDGADETILREIKLALEEVWTRVGVEAACANSLIEPTDAPSVDAGSRAL